MSKDKDIEKFAKKLQEIILDQARNEYSDVVIDHWQNPRNFKETAQPDGHAKVKGTCGDTMEMFVKIKKERIIECAFQTDGCGTSIACGSITTEMAKNRPLAQALVDISSGEILEKLGGLPEENVHCAHLAAETLREAITNCLNQKKP